MKRLIPSYRMIPAFILLLAATAGIGQTGDPLPGPVEYAKKKFDGKMAIAQRDFLHKSTEAHRTYLTDLEASLKAAMRDSRLDEANAINKEIALVKDAIETIDHDPLLTNNGVRPGLAIVKARYGTDGRWDDVTAFVRSKVTNNQLTLKGSTDTFGHDPAPYVHKYLELDVTVYGIDVSFKVDEGDTVNLKAP